jgi:hypothetical protein
MTHLGVTPHLFPVACDVVFDSFVDNANGRRIDENFSTAKGGDASCFRVPLIVTDEGATLPAGVSKTRIPVSPGVK